MVLVHANLEISPNLGPVCGPGPRRPGDELRFRRQLIHLFWSQSERRPKFELR